RSRDRSTLPERGWWATASGHRSRTAWNTCLVETARRTPSADGRRSRSGPSQPPFSRQREQELPDSTRCDAFQGSSVIEIPFQHQLAVAKHVNVPWRVIADACHEDEPTPANLDQ